MVRFEKLLGTLNRAGRLALAWMSGRLVNRTRLKLTTTSKLMRASGWDLVVVGGTGVYL